MSKILKALSLRPATLAKIEAQLRDGGGEERQPAPRKFVLSGDRDSTRESLQSSPQQTLKVWTGQEPGERIANTILLCAIRDRAHQVTLEPSETGVHVRFAIESGVREQKLPAFALAPIVRHFKTLANEAASSDSNAATASETDELCGQVAIAVDEQLFHILFSPLQTQWGAGVKVQFSPCKSS